MNDAQLLNEAFEYDAYRTRFGDEVRTLGVIETFGNRDMYLTATITEDDVTVDWVGYAFFTGAPIDRDALNDALLAAGVPTPVDDAQFAVLQSAYDEVAGRFFQNAWKAEEYDGVYMDDEYVYFMVDEASYDYLRTQVEDRFNQYERRVERERGDPKLDEAAPLTEQQRTNIDVISEALPTPDFDVEGTLQYAGKLVPKAPLETYRRRALELHLNGLMPIKEAQAHALREDGGRDRVEEVFEDDAAALLDSADAYFRNAQWMVTNAMPDHLSD